VEEEEGVLSIEKYTNEKWWAEAKKVFTVGYNLRMVVVILENTRCKDGQWRKY
jgi:hypothetical protein